MQRRLLPRPTAAATLHAAALASSLESTMRLRVAIGAAAAASSLVGSSIGGSATTTTAAAAAAAFLCHHPRRRQQQRLSGVSSSPSMIVSVSSSPFHSSPTLRRKSSRSQWKSAKKYAAAAAAAAADDDGERDDEQRQHRPDDGEGSRKRKSSASRRSSKTSPDAEQDEGGPSAAVAAAEPEPEPIYDDPPDHRVRSRTLSWINNVVIGLNLCPFAASPLKSDQLSIQIIRGNDLDTVASAVLLELILRVDEPGTTVVVAPECHPNDFESYLKVVQYIEETLMTEHDLHGKVQLAPFHPRFEFGGSGPDGVDNYTNRSPYPAFHVLREEEVSDAVEKLDGDAGKVWRRNVNLLERMDTVLGREAVERIMAGEDNGKDVEGLQEILREIKDDDEEE